MDGLKEGEKFTLREIGNAIVNSISQGENGSFIVEATLATDDKDYKGTRKVCWVPAVPSLNVRVQCVEYEHFLTKESLEEGDNVNDFINVDSKHISEFVGEKGLA